MCIYNNNNVRHWGSDPQTLQWIVGDGLDLYRLGRAWPRHYKPGARFTKDLKNR